MRRFQLIEIEDMPWCPRPVRDAATDFLQFMIERGQLYHTAASLLSSALRQSNDRVIVDLCSGAGGPWESLLPMVQQEIGEPISVKLTDAYPNQEAFTRLQAQTRGGVMGILEPVDAMDVPVRLRGFRTLFSSFHHFRPAQAKEILQDAVRRQNGIAIFEALERRWLALFAVLFAPIFVGLVTPAIRPFRWSRLFWTYVIPAVPLIVLVDGIVSCLRAYTAEELRAMVESLDAPGYRWEIGEAPIPHSPIRLTYLIGLPPNEYP